MQHTGRVLIADTVAKLLDGLDNIVLHSLAVLNYFKDSEDIFLYPFIDLMELCMNSSLYIMGLDKYSSCMKILELIC